MIATYNNPGNWVDLATHHQNCSQVFLKIICFIKLIFVIKVPGYVEAFVFTQDVAPAGWDVAQYGQVQWPMRVLLVDKVPSAHSSTNNYKVAILYEPTNLPGTPNNRLGYPGESGRIKAVCCGLSVDIKSCIVGSRIEPCAHGATILKLGCVIPHHQNSFRSTHRDLNVVDPGNRLPVEFSRDLLAGSMQ